MVDIEIGTVSSWPDNSRISQKDKWQTFKEIASPENYLRHYQKAVDQVIAKRKNDCKGYVSRLNQGMQDLARVVLAKKRVHSHWLERLLTQRNIPDDKLFSKKNIEIIIHNYQYNTIYDNVLLIPGHSNSEVSDIRMGQFVDGYLKMLSGNVDNDTLADYYADFRQASGTLHLGKRPLEKKAHEIARQEIYKQLHNENKTLFNKVSRERDGLKTTASYNAKSGLVDITINGRTEFETAQSLFGHAKPAGALKARWGGVEYEFKPKNLESISLDKLEALGFKNGYSEPICDLMRFDKYRNGVRQAHSDKLAALLEEYSWMERKFNEKMDFDWNFVHGDMKNGYQGRINLVWFSDKAVVKADYTVRPHALGMVDFLMV